MTSAAAAYAPVLTAQETEAAIRKIKHAFERNLAYELDLLRVTAPLFVECGTGLNDDLSGHEPPVAFDVPGAGKRVEVVHSLAKWKRVQLRALGIRHGGIVCDMNAIRATEVLDRTHSIYVDQWDWECVMRPEDRTLAFLKRTVDRIYHAIFKTAEFIAAEYRQLQLRLPHEIVHLHTEDVEREFPGLTPKQREAAVCRRHGAVCLIGIGHPLPGSKAAHDARAPDYDDWSTETEGGRHGLNCDILVWDEELGDALELSSMGIRVDAAALARQLEMQHCEQRRGLPFHTALLAGELPLSIGGGIGQSRLCMFLLQKAHIGEVQASVWGDADRQRLKEQGIVLL